MKKNITEEQAAELQALTELSRELRRRLEGVVRELNEPMCSKLQYAANGQSDVTMWLRGFAEEVQVDE